ncbi:unnamed protein product [Calicophoron daubneyi]|uniref:Uncharacterized protein n=1 Tax=Calicophoron daubneyi TaxID=300641 RepID=A0AAV2TVW4_CALDB
MIPEEFGRFALKRPMFFTGKEEELCGQQAKTGQSNTLFVKAFGGRHFVPHRVLSAQQEYFISLLKYIEEEAQSILVIYKCTMDYDKKIGLKLLQLDELSLRVLCIGAPFLKSLDLSMLNIQLFPRELLCKLTSNLSTLYLNWNQLDMTFFDQLHTYARSLKSARAKRNQKKGVKSCLATLREIQLQGNRLMGTLPSNPLAHLKNLKRLNLRNNQIDSLKNINILEGLQVLMLENNQLTTVHGDLFKLRALEFLYLANNRIGQPLVGAGLRNLTSLRVIDLSNNALLTLPGTIFVLEQLEVLNASHNSLMQLPSIQNASNPRAGKIKVVDLSYNCIGTLPIGLAKVTNHLDISHNRIRIIPASLLKWLANTAQIKKCRASQFFQIDIQENPLTWPPPSVAADGIDGILEFYYESRTESQSYHGLRVFFLGGSECGKTSLALSMLDGQSRFTDSTEEKTFGIDKFEIPFDAGGLKVSESNSSTDGVDMEITTRPTNLSIWDCSGQECYTSMISYFSTSPAVAAILVDVSEYGVKHKPTGQHTGVGQYDAKFHSCIGRWIDVMMLRTNQVIVVLVGTKCDKVTSANELNLRLLKMHADTTSYIGIRNHWLSGEIDRIEALPTISPSTEEFYERLNKVHQTTHVSLWPTAISTTSAENSSAGSLSWYELCRALFGLSMQSKKITPHVLAPLPQIWSDIETYLEDLRNVQPVHSARSKANSTERVIFAKTALSAIIEDEFHISSMDTAILFRYLYDTGQIYAPDFMLTKKEKNHLGSTSKPCPTHLISINPSLTFEPMKYLLNPHLNSLLHSPQKKLSSIPSSQTFITNLLRKFRSATWAGASRRFEECRAELSKGRGVVLADLWTAMTEYCGLLICGSNIKTGRYFVEIIWRWMELAYPVPESGSRDFVESEQKDETVTDWMMHTTPMELALQSGIYGENRPASSGARNSLAFPGSPPTGEATNSTSVGSVGLPALLFPCLITKKSPPTVGSCAAAWELACSDGPPAITPVLRFYHNFPEECFTRITVRLNWPEIFKFYYTFHWKTGVQMHNPDYNVIVRLSLDKSIDEDCFVRFEVRALPLVQPCAAERTEDVSGREKPTPGETNVDIDQNSQLLLNKTGSNNSEEANEDQKEKMKRKGRPRWHGWPISEESLWDLIIPVLKEIESVLCAYPGLCYKRMLECPNCKELTFSGEWLTPQEIQTTRYRKCPACVYKLASCLIAPPERGKEYP